MNFNYLSFSDIKDIIDSHIKAKYDFMFVTDANLAYCISEYLDNKYDIEDKSSDLYSNTNEFYLSVSFYGDEIAFFCEDAKGNDGKNYKLSDLGDCNYFIGSDMPEKIIHDKLTGNDCTWTTFKLAYEKNNCDCNGCDENEIENEISLDKLLDLYVERIQYNGGCPRCIKEILEDLVDTVLEDDYNKLQK